MRRTIPLAAAGIACAAYAAAAGPLNVWEGLNDGLSATSTGASWAQLARDHGYETHMEGFEDEAPGRFGTMSLDFGTGSRVATVTAGAPGAHLNINDDETGTDQRAYQGTNYLYFGTPSRLGGVEGANTFRIDFTTGDVRGFSFYFGDLELAALSVTLDNGTTIMIDPGEYGYTGDDGHSGWFGYLQEPGSDLAAISGVTFTVGAVDDAIAIDNFWVARGNPVSTPVPGAGLLAAAGMLAIPARRSRRR